jgi:hypothetical protein
MNLLTKISKNSKKKFKEIQKTIDIRKTYKITFDKINNQKKIFFIDNKNIKLIGDYHFYGIYNTQTKLWTWANILPNVSIDTTKYIDEIRTKGYLFEKMANNNQTTQFFYQFLTNDIFLITDTKYLALVIDVLLYITDEMYIFEQQNNSNEIFFYGLTKISELF